MERKTLAKRYFNDGLNCAQSVLCSFKAEIDVPESELQKISAGFGGGMAKLQQTCGAVTGSYMVVGLMDKTLIPNDSNSREKTNILLQEFDYEFKRIHKSTQCSDLLGINLLSEDGKVQFEELNLRENVCERCIEDAVTLIESKMQV